MPQVQNCKDCKTLLTLENTKQIVFEAKINANGTVQIPDTLGNYVLLSSGKTVGSGVNDAGNDYELVFASKPPNVSEEIQITGALGTIGGDNNFFKEQDIRWALDTLYYSLYEGDDGDSRDEAVSREHWIRLLEPKQIVTSAVTECDGQVVTNECFCQDELDALQDQINNNSTAIANFTDTNDIDYVSNVVVSGNNLVFTGVGNGFTGTLVLPLPPTINPATTVPIADNEIDTAIRTGQVGISALYARADHNHPIRRQAVLPDPALTYGLANGSTAPQTIVVDRWSDEESVTYAYRVRMDIQAGNGWNFITVSNLAGFQRPQITIEGTYRNTGNPQRDDGVLNANDGAMPTAPYMGQEFNHWSSTQRLYNAGFRKEAFARYYVAVTVKYTRI